LLVLVGGRDHYGTATTSAIKLLDESDKSWRHVASLSSARCAVAIAAVNDNAIIVIGGRTKGGKYTQSSMITTVELGQTYL